MAAWPNMKRNMICVSLFIRCSPLRRHGPLLASLLLAVFCLSGCAGQNGNPVPAANRYVVFFSATHPADHAVILSVSVPVTLGNEASVKTSSRRPVENQPVLPQFLVRLNRRTPAGVYELVTRVAVREAIRNKKGKLKITKRFIGALVPTRLGETQVVSAESDPIHLEARLERR